LISFVYESIFILYKYKIQNAYGTARENRIGMLQINSSPENLNMNLLNNSLARYWWYEKKRGGCYQSVTMPMKKLKLDE